MFVYSCRHVKHKQSVVGDGHEGSYLVVGEMDFGMADGGTDAGTLGGGVGLYLDMGAGATAGQAGGVSTGLDLNVGMGAAAGLADGAGAARNIADDADAVALAAEGAGGSGRIVFRRLGRGRAQWPDAQGRHAPGTVADTQGGDGARIKRCSAECCWHRLKRAATDGGLPMPKVATARRLSTGHGDGRRSLRQCHHNGTKADLCLALHQRLAWIKAKPRPGFGQLDGYG